MQALVWLLLVWPCGVGGGCGGRGDCPLSRRSMVSLLQSACSSVVCVKHCCMLGCVCEWVSRVLWVVHKTEKVLCVNIHHSIYHVLLEISGLHHQFSCICQVLLWYRRRQESIWKEKCESSSSSRNGAMRNDGWWQYTLQQKMRFLFSSPSNRVPRPLTAVCTTKLWLENLWGSRRPPSCPPQTVILAASPWALMLGLWPGARGKHRATALIFSYDVACRKVLIWTECDNSKLQPTKGTEAWGKLSHSGLHND